VGRKNKRRKVKNTHTAPVIIMKHSSVDIEIVAREIAAATAEVFRMKGGSLFKRVWVK